VRGGAAAAIEEDQNAVLLEQLANLLAADPDASVRRNAANALARYAYRAEVGELPKSALHRTRTALLSALRSEAEQPDVRAAALGSAGYFSDDEVRGELRVRSDDEQTRLGALRGMGHSADPRWLDVILAAVTDDEEEAREEAARAAGEIEDERAVGALADLVDDPSTDVRLAALRSLGQIGGEQAREALIYALGDQSPLIRDAAERALEVLDDDPLT
jgi:HEAT repeat protein